MSEKFECDWDDWWELGDRGKDARWRAADGGGGASGGGIGGWGRDGGVGGSSSRWEGFGRSGVLSMEDVEDVVCRYWNG
jgi:hypothetical protein